MEPHWFKGQTGGREQISLGQLSLDELSRRQTFSSLQESETKSEPSRKNFGAIFFPKKIGNTEIVRPENELMRPRIQFFYLRRYVL